MATNPDGPKPLSRSRKSADKRDAIIRAAIEIINAKSYSLATMTEIAASLDLRDAALYYYFHSKQALAYACHIQSLGRFDKLLGKAENAGGSGAAKLQKFIRLMLDDASHNGPQLYFGDYSYLNAAQRETVDSLAAVLRAQLERFLREGMADGSIVQCEPHLVVHLLIGMLVWLAKWVPSIEGMTVDRLMNAIGAFSLHGLESRNLSESPDTHG
jgi:AcrR family transcriptional regulator